MVSAVLADEVSLYLRRRTQRGLGYAFTAAVILHIAVAGFFIDRSASTEQILSSPRPLQASLIIAPPKPDTSVRPNTTQPLPTPAPAPTRNIATPKPPQPITPAPLAATPVAEPVITRAVDDSAFENSPLEDVSSQAPIEPQTLAAVTREPQLVSEHKATPATKHYIPPTHIASLNNPEPRYPRAARMRGMQGVVQLKVLVDEHGRAIDISLAQSSGFNVLDNEAIRTVEQWRFMPATENGIAVAGEVLVPIRFQLNG